MAITSTFGNPIVITQAVAQGGAATGTAVSTLTRAVKVVDVQGYVTAVAAGGDITLQLASNSGNIMPAAVPQTTQATDKEVIRATDLDDAHWSVAVGGTLTTTIARNAGSATTGAANVNITCMDVQ
tara:strand:- start:288 stop:665 length:378 start_codon:yes stop_codon:yes gene_type:complete